MRKVTISIAVAIAVLCAVGIMLTGLFLLAQRIPKRNLTFGTATVIKKRILLYIHKNNKMPTTLNELPRLKGYNNSLKDGWGNTFTMAIKNNTVILFSYDPDKGQKLKWVFEAKQQNGKWIDRDTPGWNTAPRL